MRALLFALILGAGLSLPAAVRIDLVAVEQDTQIYLASLRRLGLGEHTVPPHQRIAPQVRVHLTGADPAMVRQATAHALGAWWTVTANGTLYRQHLEVPHEPLLSRTYTSALVADAAWEPLIKDLLAPWLAVPGSGIALDPGSGLWVATLDAAGQHRLVTLIGVIERREPTCPTLIPHPLAALPMRATTGRITAQTWADLATRLAQQLGISISRSADLPPPPVLIDLPAGSVNEHGAHLARWRIQSAWIDGVWCWSAAPPVRREHPAQRSRFALLPTIQIRDNTSGHLLASALSRAIFGEQPAPGQRVHYVPALRGILASGDAEALHQLWDRLERAELDGLPAAVATERP